MHVIACAKGRSRGPSYSVDKCQQWQTASSIPILFTRAWVFLLMIAQNMCAPKMLSLPLTMNRGCQNSASSLYIFCAHSHLNALNILHGNLCQTANLYSEKWPSQPFLKALLMSWESWDMRSSSCCVKLLRQSHCSNTQATWINMVCYTKWLQVTSQTHRPTGIASCYLTSRAGAQSAAMSDILGFWSAAIGHLDSILDVVFYVCEACLHRLPLWLDSLLREVAVHHGANGGICRACSKP